MKLRLLWIVLLISVGVYGATIGSSLMVTCQLNQALNRVKDTEVQTAKLMAEFDSVHQALTQCDTVILERQNIIIQELRRLDFNQKMLIGIAAPVEGEDVE